MGQGGPAAASPVPDVSYPAAAARQLPSFGSPGGTAAPLRVQSSCFMLTSQSKPLPVQCRWASFVLWDSQVDFVGNLFSPNHIKHLPSRVRFCL